MITGIKNQVRIWYMATRPKTLPAAASGVVIGGALAIKDGLFSFWPWLAAVGVAFLLQIGSNLANDVYDYERGTDTAERKGPTRVTHAGLLTPGAVKRGMLLVLGAAFLLGVYLTFVRGWVVMAIGLAAIAAAVAYTGGPFPLGYHGLGEVFVYVFFGQAAVTGTYFVLTGTTSELSWLMAVPVGLIITALLVVNNLRDINEDRAAGKGTLAVRLGVSFTRAEYLACMGIAYGFPVVLVVAGKLPVSSLAVFLSAPLAYRAARIVLSENVRSLNPALAFTSQTAFVYSIFFAAGILLPK
ncbi:MAG: 1,4-dihydroxy-2-naphthoate polyprenyltransferase [Actinomycetota bacterium]